MFGELKHFFHTFEWILRALENLSVDNNASEHLLVCIILRKLPPRIIQRIRWKIDKEITTLDELCKGLKSELDLMELDL